MSHLWSSGPVSQEEFNIAGGSIPEFQEQKAAEGQAQSWEATSPDIPIKSYYLLLNYENMSKILPHPAIFLLKLRQAATSSIQETQQSIGGDESDLKVGAAR